MEAFEKFEIEIVFNNINYIILNKVENISDNSNFYLNKSIDFLNGVIKSLDSLNFQSQIEKPENHAFSFFPQLKEVVLNVPRASTKINDNDLKNIKKYFLEVINEINKLKASPAKFYKTKKSEDIRIFAEKIALIYSEKLYSHTFETEETFSTSYILC